MGFNHIKGIIRSASPHTQDNFKAIQISESHFWQLTMALQDTSLSEVISPYETSGPSGTADGWGADKAIYIAMETEDTNNLLAVALSHQLDTLKFKKYDEHIQIHINNFNKIVAQIKDMSPNFYPPYVILNKFMQSIENKTYNTLKTLAMSQNWDLGRAQKEFRKHEILKLADKLSYIYPLEEKRVRKQNPYYKNRRTKNYNSEKNDESSDSQEDSHEEEIILERRNFAKLGHEKQERTEEFSFPDNVHAWQKDKHGNKLKLFRNHL